MCGELILLTPDSIQGQRLPASFLRTTGTFRRQQSMVETYSYKDSDKNILVHWMRQHRPDDEANCWLYLHRLKRWFME